MNRVIAPTDFSEASLRGVHAARRHAQRFGAALLLVHVWDRAALTLVAPHLRTERGEAASLMSSIEADIEEALATLAADLSEGFGDIETRIIHGGSPPRALAELAEPDDVIVLSTHGRTGFKRLLIGSVAEKVVRLAPCPVLTVPGGAA